MKLFVLFAQRKCRYDGEYAPEPMEVTNEFVMDELPEWMDKKKADLIETGEYTAVELVEVNLGEKSDKAIYRVLNRNIEVDGEVENEIDNQEA